MLTLIIWICCTLLIVVAFIGLCIHEGFIFKENYTIEQKLNIFTILLVITLILSVSTKLYQLYF